MRFRYGWLLHILLVPATYAAVRGSIALMLAVASEPDSDGPTRWATDPAVMLMVVCPIVYFLILGSTKLREHSASANDCYSRDRKSDALGKSVSVRVNLGGGRT